MHKIPAQHPLNAISTSIFLAIGSLLFSLPSPLLAQIEPDSTLGGESSQVVPVTPEADAITGGATRGSNLFHSFGTFNIDEGRAAYFVPDTEAIRTIFSRVTGGNPSQILGTLGVVGNANLFLINPAGILFGPNAKLDMSGSFIASTANSITFPNGQFFNATNPNAPPLLTIDVPVPIGLRFEGDEPREIFNTGNLTTGENIALVGGVIGNAGQISAPGKDIVLSTIPTGVSSVVNFDGTGKFIGQTQGIGEPDVEAADIFLIGGKLDASSTGIAGNVILDSAGDLALSDGALVDVRGAGGGNITVSAQNLEMSSGSEIRAGIGAGLGFSGARAGNIEINVAEGIKVQGTTDSPVVISNIVGNGSIGNAGEVIINTETLEGRGQFAIGSFTFGQGNAGRVGINAADKVSLDGLKGGSSGILSSVGTSAIGNGGDLIINTRSLSLANGAIITTATLGSGNGGNLTVNASESVQVIGTSANNTSTLLGTGTLGKGKAGDLSITTGQLLIRNGARIGTDTNNEGDGGNLTVNASESIQVIGTSAEGLPSGLTTIADLTSTGKAGNLNLSTRQLLVQDGAAIATSTAGSGNGGNLTINASELVQLIGTSANGSATSNLNTIAVGTGNAGNINLTTGRLLVQNGAAISTSTAGSGDGGKLSVNASDLIGLSDRSFLTTASLGTGNAGEISINTSRLLLQNGSLIFTTTGGIGAGGNLTVSASESIELEGTFAESQIPSLLGTGTDGEGNAGNLSISTGQLLVSDGARIATDTEAEGNGGDLTINASESIKVIGTSAQGLSSRLSSLADTTSTGKAGNLNITTGDLLVRDGATIATTTRSSGDGGNLTVNASESVQLIGTSADGSSTSNLNTIAGGKGKSGNLTINTRELLIQDGAFASTTTVGEGNGGNLTVNASQSVQLIGISTGGTFSSLLTGTTGQGNAGDLAIRTGQLLVRDGAAIATTTTGSGDAGNLAINTEQLLLRGGAAILTNTASEGDGGKISIQATDLVSLEEVSFIISGVLEEGQGNGGDINIRAGNFSMTNGSLLLASTTGQGNAGNINFDIDKTVTISGIGSRTVNNVSITIPSIIASQVESGGEGNGGDISVRAESLFMNDFGFINTGTSGRGNAGNISIDVDDFVRLNNGSVVQSNVEPGGVGQGGNINIQARSLTLANGGEIQAGLRAANEDSPGGIGTGGNININASNFVEISGVSPISAQFSIINPTTSEELFLNRGLSSGIFGSTQQGANGSAGNITIATGAFRLADGAVVEAQTANQGNAGNITINANTFEVTGGGQVITATRGSGKAGNIILNIADNVTLSGSDPNFEQRLELLQGNTAQFTNISPSSGLFANTTEGSSGNGGSIFIDPRTVTISDGAIVSVNSQGSGTGGEIDLTAGSLSLDEGTISAQTDSTTGGNIALNVENVLLLRNGSQISTTAGTGQAGGDGGNIIINAGAIIANPLENSDITANAFLGRGGNILINTESIFGIDFRQRLTPLSDITASSEAGLAGTVEINTSGIDPTRGLEALTEERINAEVAQGCQAGAQGEGTLSFFNLGRGGTPSSPDDLFNSPMTGEWLSLELEENQKTDPQSHLESQFQQMSHNTVWLTCPSKRARSIASP
jgi:filamentous hemagglutinin family protein